MNSSYDEEEEFNVNPFRSSSNPASGDDPFYTNPATAPPRDQAPAWSQQADVLAPYAASQAPYATQQPLQQQPLQPDPNSGMIGTMHPPPLQQPYPTHPTGTPWTAQPSSQIPTAAPRAGLSGTMDQRLDPTQHATTSGSLWYRCTSCFRIEGYQPYFDLDTSVFAQRVQASLRIWWQPDVFRTTFLKEDKPD